MRLRLLALAGLLAAFFMAAGSAFADTGTFSGSITPTDCGPLQPAVVAPGDTTIVAAAAMTVSANDIKLELYDPSGMLKVDGDSATSPETVRYQSPNLQAGTWNVQVCPFPGGVIAAPYTYTGTYATSNVPVTQVAARVRRSAPSEANSRRPAFSSVYICQASRSCLLFAMQRAPIARATSLVWQPS